MIPSITHVLDSASSAHPEGTTSNKQFAGKRVGMVTYSSFPFDPRPRRAVDVLVAAGASVDLICLAGENAAGREVLNGIHVLRIPLKHERAGKFRYAFGYAAFILISSIVFALRSLARRYDLIYVHNMPDILVLSALIPKMLGAKVVLDLHDPMPELMMAIFHVPQNNKSVKLLKHIEKWSIARANLAITVSLTFKRIFCSRSCQPEKMAVVMNSPDSRIFPFRMPQLHTFRNQDGDRRFVIMYHGSLIERNGLEVAIDAIARIRDAIPGIEFRIIGTATPFLDRVMEAARSKHLGDTVRYLGPRRLEDLVAEIDNCDLGVIPNQRNAFTEINTPTRMFEYLVLGKPVIAPSTSGIREYFSNDSLLFFEPGDAGDLARQIEYAFSHPHEVLEIVQRGQQVYLEHTWERQREMLLSRVGAILSENSLR
jgi:glycosyltransferase involved in cell wall biosynthesis